MYETSYKFSPNKALTKEGFLICENAVIASTAPRTYTAEECPEITPDASGLVTLMRPESVLFAPETIASFEGKPVTLNHPDGNWVDGKNWKDVVVGMVSHVRAGEGDRAGCLVADLIIQEPNAVQAVLRKQVEELSCGFSSQATDQGDGIGLEESFNGNHVALVPKARGGDSCRLADSLNTSRGPKMFGKKDEDVNAQILEQLKAMSDRIAALEKAKEAEQTPAPAPVHDAEKEPAPATPAPAPETTEQAAPEEKKDGEGDIPSGVPVAPVLEGIDPAVLAGLMAFADAFNGAKKDAAKPAGKADEEKETAPKADAAMLKDVADIAPSLPKDTPNIAHAAVMAFAASSAEADTFVKGFGEIKADAMPSVLRACANFKRTAMANSKVTVKNDSAKPVKSFSERAAEFWKKSN